MIIELFVNTEIIKYIVKLIKGKQLLYGSIYALNLIKLKILKTYIKIHLKIGFIGSFKSFIGVFIYFNKKPNNNLHLYIDY